jgi:hypothetical protein
VPTATPFTVIIVRRIAIPGHRGLPAETVSLIDAAIRAALPAEATGVIGLSCLADGADQIFARAVLDLGGRIGADCRMPQDAILPPPGSLSSKSV